MQSTAGKCQNERATFEKFIGLFVPEHLVKAFHLRLLQMYYVPDQRHNQRKRERERAALLKYRKEIYILQHSWEQLIEEIHKEDWRKVMNNPGLLLDATDSDKEDTSI
jgi:hypothetical protein